MHQRREIPTCTINKSILLEIYKMLETIAGEKKSEQSYSPSLTIEIRTKKDGKDETNEYGIQYIRDSNIPRHLQQIEFNLNLFNEGSYINIDIDFDNFIGEPHFIIKAKDPVWVDGISEQIQKIFEKTRNKNYLFRENKFRFPIIIPISILLGFGISAILSQYFPPDKYDSLFLETSIRVVWFFGATVFSAIFLFLFFWWLFPRMEYEDYFIQSKIRKLLLLILIGVISGLLVIGITNQ